MRTIITVCTLVVFALAGCGSDPIADSAATTSSLASSPTEPPVPVATTPPVVTSATAVPDSPNADDGGTDTDDTGANGTEATAAPTVEPAAPVDEPTAPPVSVRVRAEVWADNWFALYANGVLVGEDSVPITTERSFNAETIEFEATLPLTLAFEAKDFKETDSGIEYIGQNNQQMGDGGIIAQFTNIDTGEVIAVTDASWVALAIHRAPLNKDCEKAADPDTACQTEIIDAPDDWAAPTFDASSWLAATEWSEAAVSPKDGYNQIAWTASAALVWGTDLEIDNTVLLRTTLAP